MTMFSKLFLFWTMDWLLSWEPAQTGLVSKSQFPSFRFHKHF